MDMQPTKEEIKSLEEKFQRIHAYNPTEEQLDEVVKSLKEKFQSMQGRIHAYNPTQEQLDKVVRDLENPKGHV